MDDSGVVGLVESVGDLRAYLEDLVDGEGAAFEALGEGLAFDALHDDVVDAVLMADVVEVADVGMGKPGD